MNALNRIAISEVSDAAQAIWPQKNVSETIASETVKILNQTYKRKFSFFNGKSQRFLVGGLFYLLGYRHDAVRRQRELANILGTSDVTIRKAYRSWLETFPDLFLDVISKMAADKELRYYVLLDLTPNLLQAEAK